MPKYHRGLTLSICAAIVATTVTPGLAGTEKTVSEPAKNNAALPEPDKQTKAQENRIRFNSLLRNGTDCCDTGNADLSGVAYDSVNLDILARAICALRVKAAFRLPEPNAGLVSRFALEAISVNDRLGNFDGGDEYALLVSDNGDYCEMSGLSNAIRELAATGRNRESNLLKQNSPEISRNAAPRLSHSNPPDEQILELLRKSSTGTKECLAAINQGDKTKARYLAEKLLSSYKSDLPDLFAGGFWRLREQNLFCTILHLARCFSDKKWYSDSNFLLERLTALEKEKPDYPGINSFILIERAINSERVKRSDSSIWKWLDKESGFANKIKTHPRQGETQRIITTDYSPSEKLRRFAWAFYCAGDLARADILLSRALKTFNDTDTNVTPDNPIIHYRESGIPGDKVMLNLNAACLKARQKRFEEAATFAREALSGPALCQPNYGATLVELASVYAENKRMDEAIAILKQARGKNIPLDYMMARSSNSSPYAVEYWLAKYLFDSGKFEEASKLIEAAIEQAVAPVQPADPRKRIPPVSKDDYDYASSVLAGYCAFALKDFARASLRYEQAGLSRRFGTLPISTAPALSRHWLQKAIDCAEKTASFPKDDLARIYWELADTNKSTSAPEAFKLEKKALALMSETNPKKASLLAEMAKLSQPINKEPNLEEISLLRESVAAAEKNKDATLCSRYLQLANAEATAGQLDQAVADCQKSIGNYNGKAPDMNALQGGWGQPILIANSTPVIFRLCNRDRKADSIKLLNMAIARIQALKGQNSAETIDQRLVLFEFYVGQKDDENALSTLDKVLECDMKSRSASYIFPSGSHGYHGPRLDVVFNWAKSLVTSKPKLAADVCNRILAAQQKQLPADDIQIASTLRIKGDLERLLKDDKAALADYQRSFEIMKLYYGETAALTRLPSDYLTILRQAGQTSEADRLENLKIPLILPPQVAQEERGKRKEIDLIALQTTYEKAQKSAPYSPQTMSALTELIYGARSKQEWALAIDSLKTQLALSERFGYSAEQKVGSIESILDCYIACGKLDQAKIWLGKLVANGGQSAPMQTVAQKKLIEAYLKADQAEAASESIKQLWKSSNIFGPVLAEGQRALIEYLVKTGKSAEAKQELHRLFEEHDKWIDGVRSSYDVIALGKLAVQAGETKYLPELLRKGEALVVAQRTTYHYGQLSELWMQVGDKAHATELDAKFKSFLAASMPRPPLPPGIFQAPDALSFIKTRKGVEFPRPSMPEGHYSFNYAALSSGSLFMEDNSYVTVESPSNSIAFAGTYGDLKTSQKSCFAGHLSFIYGGYPGTSQEIVPPPLIQTGGGNGGGGPVHMMGLPQAFVPPFKPGLLPPENCKTLEAVPTTNPKLLLKPGSYKVSNLEFDSLVIEPQGRVRLFIVPSAETKSPVFHARINASINPLNLDTAKRLPRLEIWYDGAGTIKLDKDSSFRGLIYAPNARIEIGPGQAIFVGSMVAKDIVVRGRSRLCYDPLLSNWSE